MNNNMIYPKKNLLLSFFALLFMLLSSNAKSINMELPVVPNPLKTLTCNINTQLQGSNEILKIVLSLRQISGKFIKSSAYSFDSSGRFRSIVYQGLGSSEPSADGIETIFTVETQINETEYNTQNHEELSLWQRLRLQYLESTLKVKILAVILLYLLLSIFILFVSIVINRHIKTTQRRKNQQIKDEYQSQLASFLFDEEIEHIEFHGINKPRNRQIFIDEIRDLHSNLHGETADKLKDLYFNLGLHKDSLKKVYKSRWDVKAKGFRELAQMNVRDANKQILNYVNSKNPILRVDAQVAMVKLSEGNPLSFLDNLTYELSYWEQINIYDTLIYHQINIDSFEPWLMNDNQSVVIFAIRMIGLFKHTQSAPMVRELLNNENPEIRLSAVNALSELEIPLYINDLKNLYLKESEALRIIIEEAEANGAMNGSEVLSLEDVLPRRIRYAIVEALGPIASEEDIPFFKDIIKDYMNSYNLRMLAIRVVASLKPEGEKSLEELLSEADPVLQNMIINVKQNLES